MILAFLKILSFRNPEFKILSFFKILPFQDLEFRILALFEDLSFQYLKFKTLADFKIFALENLESRFWPTLRLLHSPQFKILAFFKHFTFPKS